MQNTRAIWKLALAGALALLVAGCNPIYRNHGYAPSPQQLDEIIVGVDTRDSVAESVGPPSASGVQRDDAWYYVTSRWQTRGAFAPKEAARFVVAISYDKAGTVTNVETFGLEKGRVVTLNRRVSDDNIKGVSFLRQLLGNIGNFTADQFLSNN